MPLPFGINEQMLQSDRTFLMASVVKRIHFPSFKISRCAMAKSLYDHLLTSPAF